MLSLQAPDFLRVQATWGPAMSALLGVQESYGCVRCLDFSCCSFLHSKQPFS